jgi:hypothetical protein
MSNPCLGRGGDRAAYVEDDLDARWQTRKERFQTVGKGDQVWVVPGVTQCGQVVNDLLIRLFLYNLFLACSAMQRNSLPLHLRSVMLENKRVENHWPNSFISVKIRSYAGGVVNSLAILQL